MPHRSMSEVNELRKSVEMAMSDNEQLTIIALAFQGTNVIYLPVVRRHGHEHEHEQLITDINDKADILLNQFHSVFTTDDINQPAPQHKNRVNKSIPRHHISEVGVLKLLITSTSGKQLVEINSQIEPLRLVPLRHQPPWFADTGKLPKDWGDTSVPRLHAL
ncbi:hypothetical protein DPMN_191469 [Dreissena polymorpha]|uniref:Uncharacterized protein n=1 Tax=Dreissena polymorpha TaxID=45954 RepID=A0A9D4BBK5_DREPO|nr:hypothetical protein DPMN_191469 [Dreissena polymorpha]